MSVSINIIKNRIKSVQETLQITKAMKLISGVKLKKARSQLEQTVPYFMIVKKTLASMLTHSENLSHKCIDDGHKVENPKKLYVILTGDKGMVGSYNSNIIKLSESVISNDDTIYVLGNVGRSHFKRNKFNLDPDFNFNVMNPTVYRARDISDQILEKYLNGDFDEVYLLYTHMFSALKMEPMMLKLLPLGVESVQAAEMNKSLLDVEVAKKENIDMKRLPLSEIFMYEPNAKQVLDFVIPKYLKGMIYGALVEAFTCEQNARMTAMDTATSNAEDIIRDLQLKYNQARQASITQEISEIIGGASALE